MGKQKINIIDEMDPRKVHAGMTSGGGFETNTSEDRPAAEYVS